MKIILAATRAQVHNRADEFEMTTGIPEWFGKRKPYIQKHTLARSSNKRKRLERPLIFFCE